MRLMKEQFADYEVIRLKDVQDTIDALESELTEAHVELKQRETEIAAFLSASAENIRILREEAQAESAAVLEKSIRSIEQLIHQEKVRISGRYTEKFGARDVSPNEVANYHNQTTVAWQNAIAVIRLDITDAAAALAEHDDKVIGETLADATKEIGATGKLTIAGTVIDFLSHSPWLAEVKRKERLEEVELLHKERHPDHLIESDCYRPGEFLIPAFPICKRLAQLRAEQGAKP